jgi:hypothetical protein
MMKVNNIGVEVEYLMSLSDNIKNKVPEYYNKMYEINDLMLPVIDGNILATLRSIRNVLVGINKRLTNKLATYTWNTSYGMAFNGLHLHLDAKVDVDILTNNLLWVINKHGITPRIATSWHVKQVVSDRPWKIKDTFRPVIHTEFGTTEIRLLDIEYMYNDSTIKDIATAIDSALRGTSIATDTSWFYADVPNENIGHWLNIMETNLADWYYKVSGCRYINRFSGKTHDFTSYYSNDYNNMLDYTENVPALPIRNSASRLRLPPERRCTVENLVNISIGTSRYEVPIDTSLCVKANNELLAIIITGRELTVVLDDNHIQFKNDAFLYLGYDVKISTNIEIEDNVLESNVQELLRGFNIPYDTANDDIDWRK